MRVFILQRTLIININNAAGITACALIKCESFIHVHFSLAIHVFQLHFPSNGIKKYLILFCHISAKSRIVQRIPTLVCEVLR